jgi:hypothetical protein
MRACQTPLGQRAALVGETATVTCARQSSRSGECCLALSRLFEAEMDWVHNNHWQFVHTAVLFGMRPPRAGSRYDIDSNVYITCRTVKALLSGGDIESAAILTPYAGQVRLLNRLAK